MKRESFVFYKSFYDSIKELDQLDQVKIYDAIFKYQFEDACEDLTGVCKSIFTLIIPQLEANNKRYINGCKGGAPKNNQNATKKQPKNNLKTTKIQPNENENDNDNDNVNVNENDIYINNPKETQTITQKKPKAKANNISNFLFIISNFNYSNNINKLLEEYINIRIKNKYTMTETVINRLCNKLNEYGETDKEKEQVILNAINGGWKDFYQLKETADSKQVEKKDDIYYDELGYKIVNGVRML